VTVDSPIPESIEPFDLRDWLRRHPPPPLERTKAKKKSSPAADEKSTWQGVSVADDFAAKTSWREILKLDGWTVDRELADGETRWTRPGKDDGISATTTQDQVDVFHAFSANAPPFKAGENDTKFQAFALLRYQGDMSAAASALYAEGYGTRQPSRNSDERVPGFPTQLPLELLRPIVRTASDPGDLVVDQFSGSGTTGVACLELGRRYLGIELSGEYAEASRRRLERPPVSRSVSPTGPDDGRPASR
jgi:hypothetical protein